MKTKAPKMLFCIVILLTATIMQSACSSLPREKAVPEIYESSAVISGLSGIRYIIGNPKDMERLAADVIDTWTREKAWLASKGMSTEKLPPSHILALSGGGDKGAFGSGFLNGWSAAGTRPEFLLVTGISIGAFLNVTADMTDEEIMAFEVSTWLKRMFISGCSAVVLTESLAA